ncbi:MAG: hypothetical protein M1834_001618 [Cirrosporium novae-zelandiae]|nr:MAG: hypothetical protein M1834_004135 [Cirrosporium novae-zelandiae]KAI9735602.1 MAG: hypothetical protein M1834_001618 [Cirrosporium novae-zelandiae]
MKFTEGMWRIKEGLKVDWMTNVERLEVNGKEVNVLLNKYQRNRGDTLNSATISAQITSPADDVIGVRYCHWDGEYDNGPHFELQTSKPEVGISFPKGKSLDYQSGDLKLSMVTTPNDLAVEFTAPNGKVTSHSWRSIGYISDGTTEKTRYDDGLFIERQGHMLTAFDLGVGEKIYGLGERFGPFVKNGQTVEVWNEDGGTSSELAYKNIPFYMSSKGYGVFINNPGKVCLELQSERTSRINISIEGEELEYFIIYGPTPKDVLRKYTALTGRPFLPPSWSYNLWLTTSFTTQYDEKTVTGFLDGFKERDIPLGVFHFDCFWMKSYQWCDFEFDKEMFPDPAGYIKRLKDRGLHISVWINPYVGQASPLFKEGKEKGYFIKTKDGKVWQWDYWQAGMAVIDFTNPAARKWFEAQLFRLASMGVDSFKTDFGERIPYKNIVYHDGSDPVRMHNYYSYLYNKCVWDLLTTTGLGQGCLFARSATVGGQKFPVHWGGDCESTFEAMAESLRGGLSLAVSGFGFWAHDIGGFEGTPPPALYKRWVQFGLLSSHSRLHGSGSYRVPWLYGEDCSAVLRDCAKRKISLTPYLLQEALQASRFGTPLMRPLFLEFPEDLTTYTIDTQYMLGPNLLVAPVFTEEGTVTFYVPNTTTNEKWTSWFDHSKKYLPGKWYTETHNFDTLPLLIRPGSVIAINNKLKDPQDNPEDGLEVLVSAPRAEGKEEVLEIVNPRMTGEVLKEIRITKGTKEGEAIEVVGADEKKGVKVTMV